jgi:precorrin-2/cobalt-factor-2 C20-methyltransferase
MTGVLYGIGVGPGDPELITVKALRLLRACPVIAYPALETGPSFARAIVAEYIDPKQIEIAIRMPMEEARFPAQAVYDRAARDLASHLDAGRDCAVLCQGDPFFYGSFMYLFERLAPHYPVQIVPGITSLTACAAMLQAPLVSRNDALTVLPATLDEEVLRARLSNCDAAAIMKLGRHFTKVRTLLRELGLAQNARYIERATLPDQAIRPLDEIDPLSVPYFAMVLVHARGSALS